MKTTKIIVIASILFFAASFSLSAQSAATTPAETPNWVIKQAKEYVAKFKDELKLTPADSTIFTDEYISRTVKTSAAYKIATTPEEKKEAVDVCIKEYFQSLKSEITPALYSKYMAFLSRSQKN